MLQPVRHLRRRIALIGVGDEAGHRKLTDIADQANERLFVEQAGGPIEAVLA